MTEHLAGEAAGDAVDEQANRRAAPVASAVLAHIVRSIVDDPDSVEVVESAAGARTRLDVHVGPGDLGRVIGRRGRTAASIRTVTRAAAAKDGVEVDIEFVDD